MRHIIPIVIFFLFLCGCKSEQSKESFREKVSHARVLAMPVVYDCKEYPSKDNSINLDSTLVWPESDRYLVGRIFPNDTMISLIYAKIGDLCYPIIYTFAPDGRGIDTLFIGGGCSNIPIGCFTSFSAKIDQDRSITIIDSMGSYKVDQNDHRIVGTESGNVTMRQYKLESNGHLSLLNTFKKNIQ